MPLYLYSCPLCGEVDNVWAGVNEMRKVHDECGKTMKRLISPTRINPDIQPYIDTEMSWEGTHIRSRRHRDEVLKEKGLYAKTNNRWV